MSGPPGSSVTITGSNLGNATGVSFNGAPAQFSVAPATRVNATVPANATTGLISVTTPAGPMSSTSVFAVLPLPSFTIHVSPSMGSVIQGQGTTFAVTLGSANSFAQLASLAVATATVTLPNGISVVSAAATFATQ